MASVRAWPRSGGVRSSAGAARRAASVSPSSCRRSTQPAPESRGYPRGRRLTRDAELQAVRREGKRIRTGLLEVRVLASPLAHSRVGVIVPKYKHSSVERNLVKRRLRELARLHLLPALARGAPADAVVRAAPAAYGAPFAALAADVERMVRQLPRVLPGPAAPPAPPRDDGRPA